MAKIQRQGIKTDTEIVTAGGAIANLVGDDQIYVSAGSINKTLKNAIIDGNIGGVSNTPITFKAFKNGGSVTAGTNVGTWTTVVKDTLSAFNASTGVYTVAEPGDYLVTATMGTTAASGGTLKVFLNGSLAGEGSNELSEARDVMTLILTDLIIGDTISLRPPASLTLVSDNTSTLFMITKINALSNVARVAFLRDVKTSGTSGGTFTSGSYQTRTLNTEVDPFNIVSLASNQFTLQAGTYLIDAFAIVGLVNGHRLKIRNVTDSTDAILGLSSLTSSSDGSAETAELSGIVTIASAKVFELQHRCQTTKSTDGFGAALSFGDSETYANVRITKL